MKKLLGVIFIFSFLIISPLLAVMQMEIAEFSGGSMSFRMALNTDFIYGSRGDGLRNGGVVSILDFNQSFTSYNPACLAFPNKAFVSMSLIPVSLGADNALMESFSGEPLEDVIGEMLNDQVSNDDDMSLGSGVTLSILELTGHIGQAPGITGLEVMVPFSQKTMGIGIAREEKFTFEMDMMLSGMEMLMLVTDTDLAMFNMSFRGRVNLLANVDVRNIVTSIGVGRQITPLWGIGVVVERHESRFYAKGAGSIDATAVYNGTTYEFNTGAHNSLDQNLDADLQAQAWGLRFGTALISEKGETELSVDFSIQPTLKYEGDVSIIGHLPPESISLTDVTLTEAQEVEGADKQIAITLPSFVRFTAAWKPGMVMALNYTHYFDPFKIDFEDGSASIYMLDSFRLGFNFKHFQIGGGVILSLEEFALIDSDSGEVTKEYIYFPIPVFSMGCVIPIGDYLDTEVELLALPYPVLKSAVTFNF